MIRALVLALLGWMVSDVALAQDCAEGRVREGGFCCWPGQTFGAISRRCEGPPVCPAGLSAHGDSCAAMTEDRGGAVIPPGYSPRTADTPVEPTTAPPIQRSATSWPASHEGDRVFRAVPTRGRDEELIIVALTIYDVGFAMGWLAALVDELQAPCGGSCGSWPYAFVPLIGGALAVTQQSTATHFFGFRTGFPLGMLSACLEGVGLVAAAIAVENRTDERSARPHTGVTVSFVPAAPGALAGMSLEGTY